MTPPDPALVARFRADLGHVLGRPVDPEDRFALAVSGGPDSLAMLLLAAAAFQPRRLTALTVDHGLRGESKEETLFVSRIAADLGVPCRILSVADMNGWSDGVFDMSQAAARYERYRVLDTQRMMEGIPHLLTAHHLDDQAETVLMRARHGAGVDGLAGIRPVRDGEYGAVILRPLLRWRKEELRGVVARTGLEPVDDPSNRHLRFDRTRARALLADGGWFEPRRLARVADNARAVVEALDWVIDREWRLRAEVDRGEDGYWRTILLNMDDLHPELVRRLLLRALRRMKPDDWPPPTLHKFDRMLERVRAGVVSTLIDIKVTPGPRWRVERVPPRRETRP